ncbi:hypothetical protein [Candidatus Vidania fulgoroideorum]
MIKRKKQKLVIVNTRIFSNDLNNTIKKIKKWIKKGINVKIIIKQRGREIEKKDILENFVIKVKELIKVFAKVERKQSKTPGLNLLLVSCL